MLDQINIAQLRPIAAGMRGAVYTDGRYAIKFGNIRPGEVGILRKAHAHGLAVKIHYHALQVPLPDDLYAHLRTLFIDQYGDDVTIDDFVLVWDGTVCCDVLIMDLATPLDRLSPDKDNSKRSMQMVRIAERLARKVDRIMNFTWCDNHPGNVGVYNGKAVMLDV